MTVSSDFVDFGINGFTGGTNSFKISRFEKLTDWKADYDRFYISFLDGNFYFAAVPLYVGGAMAFGCASQKTDASAVAKDLLAQRIKDRNLNLRYYSADVHLGAFAMPPYLRDLTT